MDDDIRDIRRELKESWAALRPGHIKIVRDRGSSLRDQLETACEQAAFDLTKEIYDKHSGKMVGEPEVIAAIVVGGLRMFFERWDEILRKQDLSGLIEIVLEAQELNLREMRAFIQALPLSLLKRVTDSAVGSVGSGTHGLMALEYMRREHRRDYKLGHDAPNGRIWAEFDDPSSGKTVRIWLDEAFEVPADD